MTKLFIANVSMQTQVIHFRVPENSKIMQCEIPPGQQRQAYQETSRDVVEAIIAHISIYGAVSLSEARRAEKSFSLVYNIDQPISGENIAGLHRDSKELRTDEGAERLKNTTAAVADMAAREGQAHGLKVVATETEIRQVSGGKEGDEKLHTKIRAEIQPTSNAGRRRKNGG